MIKWTEDLSVGNDMIDTQHRELFERINNLIDAIKTQTCKLVIGDTTKFLEDYVVTHFSDEEKFMSEMSYPGLPAHKAQHEHFMREFARLKDELRGESSSYTRSVLTNQIVVDWIVDHINQIDKAYGKFLKERAGASQ